MKSEAVFDIAVQPVTVKLTDREFRRISNLVYQHAGITLGDNKRELVVARLGKRIRDLGMRSVADYLAHLDTPQGESELITMLDAISTNLTSFWREARHFEYLSSELLPRILLRLKHNREFAIRGWSAGCSTGEEPYGLAMLLLSELTNIKSVDLKILATDISTRVLAVARAGVYSADRVSSVPPEIRRRFMLEQRDANGIRYAVSREVQAVVSFARLNLMEAWPMKGPFDFIFCRNVMIYFDKPTQERLVNRFYDLLRPSGILFIGHSEGLTGVTHNFRYIRPTVYEKP